MSPLEKNIEIKTLGERDEIANRLFFRLYQASNLMHKVGTSAVSAFGTTTQQWAVLGAFDRPAAKEKGLSVKELMEYLRVSRQSLTAVLNRLEEAGLLERTQDDNDGRLRYITLTQKGVKTWAAMRPNIFKFYEESLKDFSTEEAILLNRLLSRLSSGLGKL